MTLPTTILFDLDETLVENNQRRETLLSAAFESAGAERFCDAVEFAAAKGEVGDADSDREYLAAAFAAAARRAGVSLGEADSDALARGYLDRLDYADVSLRPGARAALALGDRYSIGLVTNGAEERQVAKMAVAGIDDAFDAVVYGSDVERLKPDPEPFETALGALDAAPNETVYVGNSLTADVEGAAALGMRTAWYPPPGAERRSGDPEPDWTLDCLSELEATLTEE